MPEFEGIKVTQDRTAAERFGLELVTLRGDCHEMLVDRPGVLGWFGNSGSQAVNLAVQLGAARVVLVGFDMNLDAGVHWHGLHPGRMNNPRGCAVAEWAARLDRQALALAELGVEVLNTSPTSSLKAFRKVSLQEALAC